MRTAILLLAVVAAASVAWGAEAGLAPPFEAEGGFVSTGPLDDAVLGALRAKGIEPANRCSDEVFVRRVFLDVIGTVPDPDEVLRFLQDERPDKRAALIESLLKREEFADYWAMKWCDLLRVKAEFPINLWPNAVQAYHRWVHDAIRSNMPYDRFARELLTSSGSNFRVAPVNFYRAVQGRQPSMIAEAVALTFMGTRLGAWPEERRAEMAAFFSRIAYKETAEWKEEIVCLDPAQTGPMEAHLPDGVAVHIDGGTDPREVFAAWLIAPDNPWFARCAVNRVWAWLMGRGIVHEPDDFRPDNPPSNPDLLAYLERELMNAKYDLRHVYRLVLNSATYQQSSVPRSADPGAETLFAYYPVRQLDAEVLVDAVAQIFRLPEGYTSAVPEPFTYIPESQRAIELADGSVTSPVLELFGRPARDTGFQSERNSQPTDAQRLHLLNSTQVQRAIETSPRLRNLLMAAKGNPRQAINAVYLNLLSRYPTEAEVATVLQYAQTSELPPPQVASDLVWALLNSKEFLFRH